MDLGCLYFPFTCEENIHCQNLPTTFETFFVTYFDCNDYFEDFLLTVHSISKFRQVDFVDACPSCMDFAVIIFLSFIHFSFFAAQHTEHTSIISISCSLRVFDNTRTYKNVSLHAQGLGDPLLQCPFERYKTTQAR